MAVTIAPVSAPLGLSAIYRDFLKALRNEGFSGDISSRYADRVVLATDNSIYQRLPQAVVFPRDADDVERLARLADQPSFRRVVLTARGGGTGTNGQSLTDGIVVDLSRHMNGILRIDAARRTVVIRAQNEAGEDKAAWEVTRAWPTKYNPTDLNGKGTDVAIDQLELCNEGIRRIQ